MRLLRIAWVILYGALVTLLWFARRPPIGDDGGHGHSRW